MPREILIKNQFVFNAPCFPDAEVIARGHFVRQEAESFMDSLANVGEGLSIVDIREGSKKAIFEFTGEESNDDEVATIWPINRSGQLENEMIIFVRPCDYDDDGHISTRYPVESYFLDKSGEKPDLQMLITSNWAEDTLNEEIYEAMDRHRGVKIPLHVAAGLVGKIDLESAVDISMIEEVLGINDNNQES